MFDVIAASHSKFFRDHFLAGGHIPLCSLNALTQKPFVEQDFADLEIGLPPGVISKADYVGYEDSLMVLGGHIKNLALEIGYLKSRSGDTSLLEEDAMHFVELLENMQTQHSVSGLITKPYGARPSNELSIDQYAELFFGMHELAKVVTPKLQKRVIDIMVSWADFWIKINYKWPYYGRADTFWACQPHAVVCLTVILIAAYHSKSEHYRQEALKLCELYQADEAPLRRTLPWNKISLDEYIRTPAYFHHLVAESLYYLIELWPQRKNEWINKLYAWWKYEINLGVDKDGLTYFCFRVHIPTNSWEPVGPSEITMSDPTWGRGTSFSYVHRCKSGAASAHIAANAMRISQVCDFCSKECIDMARFILTALNEPRMMMSYIDTDGKQLRDHEKYLGQEIQGKSYVHWMCAYLMGKKIDLW